MIEESGLVVNTVDDDNRYVWVQTQRKSACGSCSAKSGCGTQLLSKVFGQKLNRVKVLNSCNAKPGDQVLIGLEDEAILKGSFALYFVPLISLIIFSFVSTSIAKFLLFSMSMIDLSSILGAIFGLVIGIMVVRIYSVLGIDKTVYEAKIIKILPKFGIRFQ